MNIQFVNRKSELKMLEDFWKKDDGIYVLWGRRRVGKTTLLKEFARGKPTIFLIATRETEKGILKNFSDEIGKVFNDPALINASFDSFRSLLKYLVETKEEKLLLVMDEFPYLCNANDSIPSILQKEWDSGNLSGINLILSGSTVSAMESEVLGVKSPLYGRRAGQYKLQPLDPLEAKGFFPESDWEEYLRLYSVVGGTPEYLLKVDGSLGLIENIMNNIADPGSMLHHEPELLFKTEVREPKLYLSIMKALSFGRTTPNKIATYVDIPRTSITRYLELLTKLDLVKKKLPVTEKNPQKSRKGRYFIHDPFFNFYFRFIFPHLSQLEQGLSRALKDELQDEFDTYMGRIFEDIVASVLVHLEKKNKMPFGVHKIGPWWTSDQEIDLIALNNTTKDIMFVECKWSDIGKKEARKILESMKEKAKRVNWGGKKRKEHYMLVARKVDDITGMHTMMIEDFQSLWEDS